MVTYHASHCMPPSQWSHCMPHTACLRHNVTLHASVTIVTHHASVTMVTCHASVTIVTHHASVTMVTLHASVTMVTRHASVTMVTRHASVTMVTLCTPVSVVTRHASVTMVTLCKSHTFGCSGTVLDWFTSCLSFHTQSVFVGHTSTPSALKCGVPLGSVLGPLLFTLYTQSLSTVIVNQATHTISLQMTPSSTTRVLPQTFQFLSIV